MLIDITLSHVVLLFGFVFGGVIAVPGGDYREYLLGGILVQTLAFGVVGAVATAVREDLPPGQQSRHKRRQRRR
jgi:ABC-2 type transport system permease protein